MRRWLIKFVSGREETIEGELVLADRSFLEIRTTVACTDGPAFEDSVTYLMRNIESYREVYR